MKEGGVWKETSRSLEEMLKPERQYDTKMYLMGAFGRGAQGNWDTEGLERDEKMEKEQKD